MIHLIAIIACCTMPQTDGAIVDSFDAIEINHYYSDSGEHIFDQFIAWRWDNSRSDFVVEAWRLWKTDNYPQKRFNGGYEVLFDDGDLTRRVIGKVYWETFTQHDREMQNRSVFDKSDRRGLTHEDAHYHPSPSEPADASDLEIP